MSQEQPPIRSRRELRKARDAQQATPPATGQRPPAANRPADGAPAPAGQDATARSRSAVTTPPAPADTPADRTPEDQTPTQRSSQIRARDRAALRTIKELEEKEGQLAAGGPPTRRQLRLQQLKEQTLTAANPVVPPAASPDPTASSGADTAAPAPAANTGAPVKTGAPAKPGPAAAAERPAPAPGGAPEGMTVEQALEARALIAAQARNQIAKMEHIASVDPEAVDPEILAEQIALAERAAVLNRRAMARQKLAEQAGNPPAPAREAAAKDKPGPSTANNLAMVTPLEFVQVPGVERPVMKPPATSHVPVTTRPGTKVPGKRKPANRPKAPAPESATGRSQVIARAEAAAKAASRPKRVSLPDNQTENPSEDLFEDLPRVPARAAHGLDPLDAATAGLTRARRNRILQFCILAFGILALIAGIILIVSGMSR
ncbi:hypothetical protein [Arthrobacter sp. NicSoilB11]|uniref:hypothetical protein n=1 Tax=Arthrobacter sp. NicSoilB11 TaxID=2830999 RepID=UPI001CC7A682|nr:hypothetical protein [Arthrobacter sp. NicSoilB11]BCW75970.1 hypothetical protein NicSoilB11_22950 [Arthrobacter sp. NicSoilB11]